jgi:hypothetical protein
MPKEHCESCGATNPETEDGYTVCCNELVCCGGERNKFGIPENYVVACCWAKAEIKFQEKDEKVPDNSYRLD